MIYFDNAATSFPKPAPVLTAVQEALQFYGANPGRSGHRISVEAARRVYRCREKLAEFFDARDAEDVVFTLNCTHAINLVLKGYLRPGDHVIYSDLEHNAVLRPIKTLVRRGVITCDMLTIHHREEDTIRELEHLFRPETRLVVLCHGSNVFGMVTPIEAAARAAHAHGVRILVDAAQTAGVLPISMGDMGIDFLCMPGHKGLYGPTGTGVLITPWGGELETLMEGGTGSASLSGEQPAFLPDRLECGTVASAGIMGLSAGLDYLSRRGLEPLYRHEMDLITAIYDGLAGMDQVRLYTERPCPGESLPVLSFNVEGRTGEELCALLDGAGFCLRGGYHCAPLAHEKMGTLDRGAARVSPGAFNTMEQVKRFLTETERIASRRGPF